MSARPHRCRPIEPSRRAGPQWRPSAFAQSRPSVSVRLVESPRLRAELLTPKPRRKQPGLWCWDLRGSFFPGFAALEQDRHWLDCVTRTEGALVEKAGLHPLALGPNRKLYGLIPTRAVIAGDLARPEYSINLLAQLRRIDSSERHGPASSYSSFKLPWRDRAKAEDATETIIVAKPDTEG